MRVYPKQGLGIVHAICDEKLDPPLIQAFEQAGRTVGYHVLEISDFEIRSISELNRHQMLRMKMPVLRRCLSSVLTMFYTSSY
jgi:RNA polymerase-interacting CarD/CdnL/TRCF family regulator